MDDDEEARCWPLDGKQISVFCDVSGCWRLAPGIIPEDRYLVCKKHRLTAIMIGVIDP